MTASENAPAPHNEIPDAPSAQLPHFGIPGFEKLSPETQGLYLKIPAGRFEDVRPIIEREIAKVDEGGDDIQSGEAKTFQADSIARTALPRKKQVKTAIESFRLAENGDPEARKDLIDQARELLGEEPDDDDIFSTVLENESGNPFAQDTVLEVMLTDEKADAYQRVLDLFNEFRGDLPSADSALKPELQIELFLGLTKGRGSFTDRTFFVRQAMAVVTDDGQRNLFEGLKELGVLNGGKLLESGMQALKELADQNKQSGNKPSADA